MIGNRFAMRCRRIFLDMDITGSFDPDTTQCVPHPPDWGVSSLCIGFWSHDPVMPCIGHLKSAREVLGDRSTIPRKYVMPSS